MDFAALTTQSVEEITAALALDFSTMDDEALVAALNERRTEATRLFSLETPSIGEVNVAEAVLASVDAIEAEQTSREAEATAAADRFAAARARFAGETDTDAAEDEADGEDDAEDGEDEADDEDAEDAEDDADDAEDGEDGDGEGDGDGTTTASAAARARAARRTQPRQTAARKVGKGAKRPARSSAAPVTITAAADVPGFATSQQLSGMSEVALAAQARAKGFPKFNRAAAERVASASGGTQVLHKFGTAQFHITPEHGADLTEKSGVAAEYDAVGEAVKAHVERIKNRMGFSGESAMAAAMAWCSPSEVVYNWIADFVVDGLKTLPEVNAPRGGLMMTEGPQLLQTVYGDGEALDDFGFGGTEAEMEADYVKECETIVCPEFLDHRLDFDGYCWKLPILTGKTFPELIADAMRVSDVAYAHKINRRILRDIIAESTSHNASGFGASMLDTLEALVQIATKERRWWNLGENAVLEVTLPQWAKEVFKFDMQRRAGLALSDVATDQKVNALFAAYNLSVEYVSDFADRHGAALPTADWPANIPAIIHPAGAFVKAQDDVINLSTVYDAASLSENEYMGVFYEQGIKVIRRGYRSTVVNVPVCTAGATGGVLPTCVEIGSI